jgi:F-type H+-transporting ATPase subunit b
MEALNKLFESNLINWLLLVAFLVYLWMKFMPGIFKDREDRINTALREAEQAKLEGRKFQEEQTARIANAEKEAESILVEAKQAAERMKADMSEKMRSDAEALQKKIDQQIATERQMAITELRSQAATVAIRLAEASLPGAITGNVKNGLEEQFVKQLDSIGNN